MRVTDPLASSGFTPEQRERFVHDGFLRIDNAFSSTVAAAARTILWSKADRFFHW